MNESEILAMINKLAGDQNSNAIIPIGDDAAGFRFPSDTSIITVDSFYEGIHFNLEYFKLEDVGWKAASASISDIAAMGGTPECALLSLGFASSPSPGEVSALVGGVLKSLDACGCELVGGDVCRCLGGLSVTVTVAGTPPESGPVLRSEARSGDWIGVTGTLGDSAGGLFVLSSIRPSLGEKYTSLIEAHLRPKPRLEEGRLLSSAGVTAMADLSDGLSTDLGHICEMSGLGCLIEVGSLPVSDDLGLLIENSGADPYEWVLSGGEDYQLVFTAPPEHFESASGLLSIHGFKTTHIGEMKPESFGQRIADESGEITKLENIGYEHFAE